MQRFPEKRYIVINSNDAGTVTTATGCDLGAPPFPAWISNLAAFVLLLEEGSARPPDQTPPPPMGPSLIIADHHRRADDPRVLAIWQHTTILPLAENNGPLVESRRHFSWLTDVQESDTNYIFRAPKFTASALSKVPPSLVRRRRSGRQSGHPARHA